MTLPKTNTSYSQLLLDLIQFVQPALVEHGWPHLAVQHVRRELLHGPQLLAGEVGRDVRDVVEALPHPRQPPGPGAAPRRAGPGPGPAPRAAAVGSRPP